MKLVFDGDLKRDCAYGPASGLTGTHVGAFSDALMAEPKKSSWILVSMKSDWKRIFAFDK